MSGLPAHQKPGAGNDRVSEQKRAERSQSCRRLVRVRQATGPEAPSRLSIVHSVNKQGIVLVLNSPVPPQTVLEIEMHGQSIVKRFARVVQSTRQAEGWLVDCSLNQLLSDSDLEQVLSW